MIRLSDVPEEHGLLRQAFGLFPSGVVAFCALDGDEPVGLAASSFTSVSLAPPLVSLCIDRASTTWPRIAGAERFGLSVLTFEQQGVARDLASRGHHNRFAAIEWRTMHGAVFIDGAAVWMECGLEDRLHAGDHEILLLRLLALSMNAASEPAVFHRSSFRTITDV
jgi:flavin reductase (DIM6/NTAB) family NADH-FMN oxidoreductase RutF